MNRDILNTTLKWLDHNRWTVVSMVMFIFMIAAVTGISGCESTTASLKPGPEGKLARVTRDEFNLQVNESEKDLAVQRVQLDAEVEKFNQEIAAFNDRVEAGIEDLDRQDKFRRELLDTAGLLATEAAGAGINPVSLVPIGIGLLGTSLGLGTSADNRRKDKVISDLKTSGARPQASG